MTDRLTTNQTQSILKNVRTIIDSTIETFPEYFDENKELKKEYWDTLHDEDKKDKNVKHIEIVHTELSDILTFISSFC